jgi:hypothetical protein
VDLKRLSQRDVDRDVVVTKLLPQRLFGLGLVKVGQRRVGMAQSLLWVRDGDVKGGGAAWDAEASASCSRRYNITQSSSHITSTSGALGG